MSYRTIVVEDNKYEYVIGRTYTKVRGLQAYRNAEIGNPVTGTDKFVVAPLNIKQAILKLPIPEFTCKRHNVTTTEMMVNPFDAEIYGRKNYMTKCAECYASLKDDI